MLVCAALVSPSGLETIGQLISPQGIKYYLAPRNVKPSEVWKTYELSNITFQAPENFSVRIVDKYQAEIKATDKDGEGFLWIDSGVYRFLADYNEAIKYYKSDAKIRNSKIREADYGVFITGQRYREPYLLSPWNNFTEIIVSINSKAVLIKYYDSSKTAIDLRTFEQIAKTIKPI